MRSDRVIQIMFAVLFAAGAAFVVFTFGDGTSDDVSTGPTTSADQMGLPSTVQPTPQATAAAGTESTVPGTNTSTSSDTDSTNAGNTTDSTTPFGSGTTSRANQSTSVTTTTAGRDETKTSTTVALSSTTQKQTTTQRQTTQQSTTQRQTTQRQATQRPTTQTTRPTTTTTQTPANVLNHFASYSVANQNGWFFQRSGDASTLVINDDYVQCSVGGYQAHTHYAHVRRAITARDGYAARGLIVMEMDFELPSDFYDRQDNFLRLMTLDNYATVDSSGKEWGANDADEWRVGVMIQTDRQLRLWSDHQNHELIQLWRASDPLSIGRHTIKVEFYPSQGTDGYWNVYLDGVKVAGQTGVRTAPTSLADDEVAMTGVTGCLDGAVGQDSQSVTMRMYSFDFAAAG